MENNNEMIKGLYETHVFVENLERSKEFYEQTLGLKICKHYEDLRATLYWVGKPKQSFIGIWEKPRELLEKRHFAFESTKEFILKKSIKFFKNNNIRVRDAFHLSEKEPIVFAWLPAISIFFQDPDDNSLELIAPLNEKPKPELGILTYTDWELKKK